MSILALPLMVFLVFGMGFSIFSNYKKRRVIGGSRAC